jgi:hypothetical protein
MAADTPSTTTAKDRVCYLVMARQLFTVTDTFSVPGRGIVLIPGISPVGNERFRVGDALLLKRPDGTELITDIGGLEFLTPNPNHELTVMLTQLPKNDVPAGTGVWSVDREHTEDQTQPNPKP